MSWALVRGADKVASVWLSMDGGKPAGAAMKAARVWGSKQGVLGRLLKLHDESSIRRLVHRMGLTDRIIKGAARGRSWDSLLELVLCIGKSESGNSGAKTQTKNDVISQH